MAKILTVSAGFPSILSPAIELTRRLGEHGHQVLFVSSQQVEEFVERQGLRFRSLEPDRYRTFLERDATIPWWSRLRAIQSRRQEALASANTRAFAALLEAEAPDLVIIDQEMHEHIIVSLGLDHRVALLNCFASVWRRPGLPPPHTSVRPGVGWRGSRLYISLLWTALRTRKWARRWHQRITRIGCDRHRRLLDLADAFGLEFGSRIDTSQWLIPYSYSGIPVLSLHAVEFEFAHRPAPEARYVGPMILESPPHEATLPSERARLRSFLDRLLPERVLIYATFGSRLSTDRDFLDRLFSLTETEPDWELLVSLGGRLSPEDFGQIPPRVQLFSWVPQLEVLRRADVAIVHGGINTIDECVVHRVPMLVYCGGETDMAGNMARVVQHGIGLAGDRRRDRPENIRSAVRRLLREPQFATRLAEMRDQYLRYADQGIAERTIDQLLELQPLPSRKAS